MIYNAKKQYLSSADTLRVVMLFSTVRFLFHCYLVLRFVNKNAEIVKGLFFGKFFLSYDWNL